MLFLAFFAAVVARIEEEALVKTILIRKNNVLLENPFYPPFAPWDSFYTGTFSLEKTDFIEIKATSVFPYPKLYFSVNEGLWDTLKNDSFTQVSLLKQQNSIKIISSFYNRFHNYVNNSYEIVIFLDSFAINAKFKTEDFEFFGSSRDNNCSIVHANTKKYLNFSVQIEQSAVIVVRKVNYVGKDDYFSVSGNAFYTYPDFFVNWLENILEVSVSNSTAKQIFFFRFHSKIPNYEISSIGAFFDKPVDYYGWDLMPRFHPQVYNYTLVGKLPSSAFGQLRVVVETFYVAVCYINISPTAQISSYMWRTNTPSESIWMMVKEDNFNLYCASLGLEYYTKNYSIAYYRKSKLTTISKVTAFMNPLQMTQGNFRSNSSDLSDGFIYSYDLRGLNDWNSIESYSPAKELVLTYKTYSSFLTFNAIQFPLTPAGVSFLFIPSDLGAYFLYNLNGNSPEQDYFFSFKSVYPLRPGNNTVILNITAEDRTILQYNKYTIPVLNPDNSLKAIQFFTSNKTEIQFTLKESEYLINVTDLDQLVWISAQLNNSNSIHELLDNENFKLTTGDSFINFSVSLESSAVYFKFILRVFAESRNWIKEYSIRIQRVDTCGNGRRFSSTEQCDDGNQEGLDGCFNCEIEKNWTCFGGSLISFDTCIRVNVSDSNNQTGNDLNSSNITISDNSTSFDNSTGNKNNTNDSSDSNSTKENESNTQVNNSTNSSEESYPDSNSPSPESFESSFVDSGSEDQSSESIIESSFINETNTTTNLNDSELEIKISSFFDDFLPYYWIFSSLTVFICLGHLFSSISDRKSAKKYNIGGLSFTCIPMISTFQMFYLISTTKKVEFTSFFSSFKWSFLIPITECENLSRYNPIILFISLVLLNSIQAAVYCLSNQSKKLKFLKTLKELTNLSGPIHLFSILSPAILSSCLLQLKNPDSQSYLMNYSMTLSIFGLTMSTSGYLLILSQKHSKRIGLKASKRFEAMFQGMQKIFLTVPLNTRKTMTNFSSKAPKNTLIQKIKRKGSHELKVPEEKPKFFSCPWKQGIVEDDSIEIPEFNIFDPLDEVDREKTSSDLNTVKLKVNNYQVSMVSCYTRFMLLSLSSVHFSFYYLLALESFIQMIYFIKKLPFENMTYNIFHFLASSNQFLLFLLLIFVDHSSKLVNIFILVLSILQSLAFVILNLYEVVFLIKKGLQQQRKARTELPLENNRLNNNETGQIVEIHENFYTEPVQSSREVPLRNCLSFIEQDLSFS